MKTLLATLLLAALPSLATAEYDSDEREYEEQYKEQEEEMDRSSWPAEDDGDDDTRSSDDVGIAVDPATGRVSPVIIVR